VLSEFEKLYTFRAYFMFILHNRGWRTLRCYLDMQRVLLVSSREILLLVDSSTLLNGLRVHDSIFLIEARFRDFLPPQLLLQSSDIAEGR
jgi:hypothetical protein